MSSFSYIKGKDVITIVPTETPWNTYSVDRSNANFDLIIDALKDPETTTEEMVALVSPAAAIADATQDYNGIQVLGGVLYYEGNPVGNSLASRILDIHSEGLPLEAWALFAENVYRNPDTYVRDELDLWLEASDLPITPDGHFLAYKKVRNNYTDIHSGTFDNSVGKTPSIERKKVDKDRNRTCSTGLHFCSKSYLPHFGGTTGYRVMVVKVNPEDVVAIPSDYKNAKGRAWRYTVVGEISHDDAQTKKWPAVTDQFEKGSNYKAGVVKTKAGTDTYCINTQQLGLLNVEHYKNAIRKYQTQAEWARSLGVGASTVKGWKQKLIALGADL